MMHFFQELKSRNELLYYFGWFNLMIAVVLALMAPKFPLKVYEVNALYKPIKFALATVLYSWTMAWYCGYLREFNHTLFGWAVILLLGFEVIYIVIQALRGQLSHFNIATPLVSFLYSMMAVCITIITLYTTYIAYQFFTTNVISLPDNYLWGIRLGLIIFVIFSFEGFVMGSRLTHTIGGPDGSLGIPFFGWSYSFGEPRVAHFIGMHALQVIPFISFYILRSTKMTMALGVLYFLYACFALAQALGGKAWIK